MPTQSQFASLSSSARIRSPIIPTTSSSARQHERGGAQREQPRGEEVGGDEYITNREGQRKGSFEER